MLADTAAAATGRGHRDDPALPRTGGPAGNAQLTAWIGLVLLVLFAAELPTLLDVRALISWHIAIGVLLVPPALAKTATTGWRIVRYYTGHRGYHQGGPPPLLLRLLGPLVVATTLALLVSGIVVLALGPTAAFTSLVTVLGQRVSALTIHQGATLAWAVVTGLHVLARTIPAVQLAFTTPHGGRRPDGAPARAVTLLATLAVAVLAAALVLQHAGNWATANPDPYQGGQQRPPATPTRSPPRALTRAADTPAVAVPPPAPPRRQGARGDMAITAVIHPQ